MGKGFWSSRPLPHRTVSLVSLVKRAPISQRVSEHFLFIHSVGSHLDLLSSAPDFRLAFYPRTQRLKVIHAIKIQSSRLDQMTTVQNLLHQPFSCLTSAILSTSKTCQVQRRVLCRTSSASPFENLLPQPDSAIKRLGPLPHQTSHRNATDEPA